MIDLIIFRDLFTRRQKWYFAVFFAVIGIIRLVGLVIIAALKLCISFLDLLNPGSK